VTADPGDLFPAENVTRLLAEFAKPPTPPEPVTLAFALALDPDGWWPCADWCCSRGCPGPGNSLCAVAWGHPCGGWCTCGHGPTRDVVRALQVAARAAPADGK
jgi:hypothetical protein